MAEFKHTSGRETFAWAKGEPFPGVENKVADAGDRAAIRLILNLRVAMPLGTRDLAGVVALGSAALYLMSDRTPPECKHCDQAAAWRWTDADGNETAEICQRCMDTVEPYRSSPLHHFTVISTGQMRGRQ